MRFTITGAGDTMARLSHIIVMICISMYYYTLFIIVDCLIFLFFLLYFFFIKNNTGWYIIHRIVYSKTCVIIYSKIDKAKILMTNGSLMKVKSIAECSKGSILQYFRPALSDNWSCNQFLVFLRVAVLNRFYCTVFPGYENYVTLEWW